MGASAISAASKGLPTSPGKKTEAQREGEKWGQEQLHPGNGGGALRPPGGGAVHCDPGFSFVHPFSALAHWRCGGGRGQLS